MNQPLSWIERFEHAIAAAAQDAPPGVVVELLSALDPNMATPFGERFAHPGARALRQPDAAAVLHRLLALVRRPTSTDETPKLSREAAFLRVRLARLLRLAANESGFAAVRVWPRGIPERLRERSTGREGTPEPASSFGFSIFNAHTELPIGSHGVALDDVDVWDEHADSGGAWVPYDAWAAAQAARSERPRVITCPRCGVDLLGGGAGPRCCG